MAQQIDFGERVGDANRVRVTLPHGDEVLFESDDPATVTSALRSLSCASGPLGYCMCVGTVRYEFTRREGPSFFITLHHGKSVRWEGEQNHELSDPGAALDWLSARGMAFVRDEYDDLNRDHEQPLTPAERWRRSMPGRLYRFFPEMRSSGRTEAPEWTASLEANVPDPGERAECLLNWFGCTRGPWAGSPSYEAVAEKMLLRLPLDVLIQAALDRPSEEVFEGAARLFCGSEFERTRHQDLARIPQQFVAQLRGFVSAWGDDEKKSRFRRVFGD